MGDENSAYKCKILFFNQQPDEEISNLGQRDKREEKASQQIKRAEITY